MQPDLSGALFTYAPAEVKKRERKAEVAAQKNKEYYKKIRCN